MPSLKCARISVVMHEFYRQGGFSHTGQSVQGRQCHIARSQETSFEAIEFSIPSNEAYGRLEWDGRIEQGFG